MTDKKTKLSNNQQFHVKCAFNEYACNTFD